MFCSDSRTRTKHLVLRSSLNRESCSKLDSLITLILHDVEKNFVSKKFRQFASFIIIITKSVSIEIHWSIEIIERYHAIIRRIYSIIMKNLSLSENEISKKIELQMTIKTINDIVDLDDLVFILFVFEAYSQMHVMNLSIFSIIQWTVVIKKTMNEIRNIHAKRQIDDALNTRNESIIISLHNLFINSNVLVWRKNNADKIDKWTSSFKLLEIENEVCRINLSSSFIEFKTTIVKSYLEVDETTMNESLSSFVTTSSLAASAARSLIVIDNDEISDEKVSTINKFTRTHWLSKRYKNMTDISIFLQIDFAINSFSSSTLNFTSLMKSRQKELNELLEKDVFKIIFI